MNQKVSSPVRVLYLDPTRTPALPVYRANLNHPVRTAEHGKAANSARPSAWADLTARRVRERSIGKTEEAKAGGNAPDMPTLVWSEKARRYEEPLPTEKANDDRRLSVDAFRRRKLEEAWPTVAAYYYRPAAGPAQGPVTGSRSICMFA